MRTILALVLALTLVAGAAPQDGATSAAPGDVSAPLAGYATRELEGWRVHVEARVAADPRGERALELLRVKLFDIARVVPEPALAKLREVPLWFSLDDSACTCACYHISPDWLAEHGHAREKAKGVEICSLERFERWTLDQPSMVLHELVHAYHDRVLGVDEPRIVAAYERVKASGRFDSVLRCQGGKERHYALNNCQEFLAEMTEAWFGVNDYWPFVRAEVGEFDPETAELLRAVWGG
jgi:hypothetical protein